LTWFNARLKWIAFIGHLIQSFFIMSNSTPTRAGDRPDMQHLETGKTYAWCSCGLSENQPWCNGAHAGSSMVPKVFQAEKDGPAAMCLCKQSKNPPYCDGSHSQA